jgi:hypothetical protein
MDELFVLTVRKQQSRRSVMLSIKSPKSPEISTKLANAINTALAKKNGLKNGQNKPLISKPSIPTEDAECLLLVSTLEDLKKKDLVPAYTHIPNETFTKSWKAKRRNVSMGVNGGYPDYAIVLQPKPLVFETVMIEMKRTKNSATSDNQKEWIKYLNASGIETVVCKGYLEAEAFFK